MKKQVIALLFAVLCQLQAFSQDTWVELKGKLAGFNNQVLVEDMSEFQYLLPPATGCLIVPDTAGNFKIRFKVAAPNYFRLGRNALYLSPGDNLTVFIDYRNPHVATFEGRGAAANAYLKDVPFPKGGSYIAAGANIKSTPEATLAFVEAMAAKRAQELAAVTQVSAEFRRLETARIKADLINSILSGEDYGIYMLKLKGEAEKAFSETYKKSTEKALALYSKDFTDPSLMKLVVYRDVASTVIKYGGAPADIAQIEAYYAVSKLVRNMQQQSDKKILADFKPGIEQLSVAAYRDAAVKMLRSLMAFGKGDLAVDFTAIDNQGKKINLSSLKGKVIYVDLWATWCGPCMAEMPHFEKLKQQYASNKEVVFVSLSIDDDAALWKTNLRKRKAGGYQWLINRNKLQAYNIVGIPRSLLIDKNFKMVNMVAPMPSDAAVAKAIDALLQ
jgi:thiol-disulfide isomerase/thioredoxin